MQPGVLEVQSLATQTPWKQPSALTSAVPRLSSLVLSVSLHCLDQPILLSIWTIRFFLSSGPSNSFTLDRPEAPKNLVTFHRPSLKRRSATRSELACNGKARSKIRLEHDPGWYTVDCKARGTPIWQALCMPKISSRQALTYCCRNDVPTPRSGQIVETHGTLYDHVAFGNQNLKQSGRLCLQP